MCIRDSVTTGWMAQSSWATRVVVHESSAVPIGDDVPWAVAATLGCGILTGAGTVLNVLRPAPGDALLVLGAGTIGLAAVMAAAHRGVARIVVSDPVEARRALALEVGATEALSPRDLAAQRPAPSFSHVLDSCTTTRVAQEDWAIHPVVTRSPPSAAASERGA